MILSFTRTVQDLLDALSEHDPEAEIRVATQPSWPVQYVLRAPVSTHDVDGPQDGGNVVWLVAGDHPPSGPYAPSGLWEQ